MVKWTAYKSNMQMQRNFDLNLIAPNNIINNSQNKLQCNEKNFFNIGVKHCD